MVYRNLRLFQLVRIANDEQVTMTMKSSPLLLW
jgi:hypothetical protein